MNLRPSGYEPDELPGCSIPRYFFRVLDRFDLGTSRELLPFGSARYLISLEWNDCSEAQRRQAQVRVGHFGRPRGGQGEARCGRERYVEEISNCVLQAWQRPTLPHLKMQYHWRWGVSRPSSGWDRVGAPRWGHQAGEAQFVVNWSWFVCPHGRTLRCSWPPGGDLFGRRALRLRTLRSEPFPLRGKLVLNALK